MNPSVKQQNETALHAVDYWQVIKNRIDSMYPVSESGFINMSFIGRVRASGLSSEQLASSLQDRYKKEGYYTNPTIQVFMSDAQGIEQQVVDVSGQVGRTGPVKWTRGLTSHQSILAAAGPPPSGSMKRINLFREKKQKIRSNQFRVYAYSFRSE